MCVVCLEHDGVSHRMDQIEIDFIKSLFIFFHTERQRYSNRMRMNRSNEHQMCNRPTEDTRRWICMKWFFCAFIHFWSWIFVLYFNSKYIYFQVIVFIFDWYNSLSLCVFRVSCVCHRRQKIQTKQKYIFYSHLLSSIKLL